MRQAATEAGAASRSRKMVMRALAVLPAMLLSLTLVSCSGAPAGSTVLTADMPLHLEEHLDDATLEALLDRWAGSGAVVPKYRYRRGWPVVLSLDLFDLVLAMEGDADLHDVLATHGEEVEEVMFDHLEPMRVFTPFDLRSGRTSG